MRLVLTIDDVPLVYNQGQSRLHLSAFLLPMWESIIDTLSGRRNYRPVFFINSDRIPGYFPTHDLASVGDLANHTARHLGVDDVPHPVWAEDVTKCQAYLDAGGNGEQRWFRYPYLRTGADINVRRKSESTLARLDLMPIPGSCPTLDWLLSSFHMLGSEDRDTNNVRSLIFKDKMVAHVVDAINNANCEAKEALGQVPPIILVLHATPLLAMALPKLLQTIEDFGWLIVPCGDVVPTYCQLAMLDEYVGTRGGSFFLRLTEEGRGKLDQKRDWLSNEAIRIAAWHEVTFGPSVS